MTKDDETRQHMFQKQSFRPLISQLCASADPDSRQVSPKHSGCRGNISSSVCVIDSRGKREPTLGSCAPFLHVKIQCSTQQLQPLKKSFPMVTSLSNRYGITCLEEGRRRRETVAGNILEGVSVYRTCQNERNHVTLFRVTAQTLTCQPGFFFFFLIKGGRGALFPVKEERHKWMTCIRLLKVVQRATLMSVTEASRALISIFVSFEPHYII